MTPMHTSPTFIIEVYYYLATDLQLLSTTVRKGELTVYTVLVYSYYVSTTSINAKATPTNEINYSCHMKAVELV